MRRLLDGIGWTRSATLLVAILLGAWEAAVRSGAIAGLLAPPPSAIVAELAALVSTGAIFRHLGVTLLRLAGGLALGSTLGIALGLTMGWSPRVRQTVDPLVAALHPIPKIALFPLLIVWLGVGEQSKIVAIAIAAFFPTVINTMSGVRGMNPVHLDLARVFGATTGQLFRRVLLPGSLPMVLSGVRIAANVAFLSTIAVEMVTAQTGLGALVWQSWQLFRIQQLFATIVVIAIIGICLGSLIRGLAARVAPWLREGASAA